LEPSDARAALAAQSWGGQQPEKVASFDGLARKEGSAEEEPREEVVDQVEQRQEVRLEVGT
jgi:hypothetical protein